MIVCDATCFNRTNCFSIIKPCIMQHGRSKETWKDRRKDNWNICRVYVCGATLAGLFAYFIKSMGWFSVNLLETTTSNAATLPLNRKHAWKNLDAATTVIVSYKENELDKDVYNS